jgi:hypothetical protein
MCAVTDAAKKSDADSGGEILFTQDLRSNSWEKIPVKTIESVEQLGLVNVGGEICRHVRLNLKTPPRSEEAGVLARLLSQRASVAAQGGGAVQLGNDGVLPPRIVLPNNGGTLPLSGILGGNGGTLPLRIGDGLVILGGRVGN